MIKIWLCVILVLMGIAVGMGIGYLIFFKRGFKSGAKEREREILMDYLWYIPMNQVADFAREAMEEKGVRDDYPLLIIRSDKYDYIGGDDVPGELKYK